MGWQPGKGDGRGAQPGPDPALPGGRETPGASGSSGSPPRGDQLADFAKGGAWDTCPPSAALESWAVAAKLGVLRALIREEREEGQPLAGGGHHGDLPDGWTKSLTHEVALALAMPPKSAEKLMWTAWDLQALLPGIGALLADGTLTYAKARAVDDALAVLADEDAAKAEAMIVPHLAGKTYGQAEKLALQAAITVDPESATRRREDAERNRARVALRRDPSARRASRATTCRPTRPWPRTRTSAPAPRNTKTRAYSLACGWISSARWPTWTS